MSKDQQMKDQLTKLKTVEEIGSNLKVTSKALETLQAALNKDRADVIGKMSSDEKATAGLKVFKLLNSKTKGVESADMAAQRTKLNQIQAAIKTATKYQKKIAGHIKLFNIYLTAQQKKITSDISQSNREITNSQKKFDTSVAETKSKMTSLKGLTVKIDKVGNKIITKKRQNVLSTDQTKYKVVIFVTLLIINISLLGYGAYLIHQWMFLYKGALQVLINVKIM